MPPRHATRSPAFLPASREDPRQAPMSVLLFAAVVAAALYLPGRLLLSLSRTKPSPLEHLLLSLWLGIAASSTVYWVVALLGAPGAFRAWPLAALLLSLHSRLRPRLSAWRGRAR